MAEQTNRKGSDKKGNKNQIPNKDTNKKGGQSSKDMMEEMDEMDE